VQIEAQILIFISEFAPNYTVVLLLFLLLLLLLLLLLWMYSSLMGLGRFFSFLIFYTVGKTPLTGDQRIARTLPTQDNTNRINAHNTDIHALSGIQTYDPRVRASEDMP
jgi:hypothetical protein